MLMLQLPASSEKAEMLLRVELGGRVLVEGSRLSKVQEEVEADVGGTGDGGGEGGGKDGRKWEVKEEVGLDCGADFDVLNDLTMYPLLSKLSSLSAQRAINTQCIRSLPLLSFLSFFLFSHHTH